jgi:hypothetical protein
MPIPSTAIHLLRHVPRLIAAAATFLLATAPACSFPRHHSTTDDLDAAPADSDRNAADDADPSFGSDDAGQQHDDAGAGAGAGDSLFPPYLPIPPGTAIRVDRSSTFVFPALGYGVEDSGGDAGTSDHPSQSTTGQPITVGPRAYNLPPPAAAPSSALALTADPAPPAMPARGGCGEPFLCFLRAQIQTANGHVYRGQFSSILPKEDCARNIIKDDSSVFIGDSHARFASPRCDSTESQLSVGFVIPKEVTMSNDDLLWGEISYYASDGFRSEWSLAGAPAADTGTYEPAPKSIAVLELFAYGRFNGGEAYGRLAVPLRHQTTGTLATGFILFDVLLRQ